MAQSRAINIDDNKVKVLMAFKCQPFKKEGQTKGDGRLYFRGIASTEKIDQQGDRVLSEGLDLSYFAKEGWFDDEHDKSVAGGLGKPTEVKVIDVNGRKALYVEGFLYDTKEGRRLYRLMKAVTKAGDNSIGLSVQGDVVLRLKDGRTVAQAWVKNIAITRNPVNTDTWVEAMEKSMRDLRDILCKAMDGSPSSGGDGVMQAGYPVPTYLTGGSAAPLMRQEMTGKGPDGKTPARRKKMKKIFTQAEWDGIAPEAKEEMKKAMEAAGVEVEIVPDQPAEPNQAPEVTPDAGANNTTSQEPAVDPVAELVKSMRDAVANGGELHVASAADIANVTATIAASNDVLLKSVDALSKVSDRLTALESKFETLSVAQGTATEEIIKAMRIPAPPKSTLTNDGAVLPHPNTQATDPQKSKLSPDTACEEITKAMSATSDRDKIERMARMYTRVRGGFVSFSDVAELQKAIA